MSRSCGSRCSAPVLACALLALIALSGAAVDGQTNTTVATSTSTAAPATPPPAPTTTAAPVIVLPTSRIDLIFSFFAEDKDSIASYTVTIAQMLNVPQRRIDFYNTDANNPNAEERKLNTPFGNDTMVRVTIQAPLPTASDQSPALAVRARLLSAIKSLPPNQALASINIIDANPIPTSNDPFSYQVRTSFDLMYSFVIGTMAVAYLGFIAFVIYKLIEAYVYKSRELATKEKEKELRRIRAASMSRAAGGKGADDDDENEVIDASKFDRVGDDDDDDASPDAIRDEDGMAVRTLAASVATMLRDSNGDDTITFSPGSRRAPPRTNTRLLEQLNRLALPPSRERNAAASGGRGGRIDDEDL